MGADTMFTVFNTAEQMILNTVRSSVARRVHAALEYETVGVRTMTLNELKAQVAIE